MNEHIDSAILIDYLHRELEPEQDAFVLAHLTECSACARAYEVEARLSEQLRALASNEERELPQGIVARVRGEIDERAPAWWQLGSIFRPAVGLPAAAVLVLATVLGFSSLRPHLAPVPTIAASYYLDDHEALASSSLPFSQTSVVPEALESGGTGTAPTQESAAAVVTDTTVASE